MTEEEGKGELERRIAERVEMRTQVRWRRITEEDSDALLIKGDYTEIFAVGEAVETPSAEALERQAYTENLSVTGLKLVGDLRMDDGAQLQDGWELLVQIGPTGAVDTVRALGIVVWIARSGPDRGQAGIFFKAINKEDVERVTRMQDEAKKSRGL